MNVLLASALDSIAQLRTLTAQQQTSIAALTQLTTAQQQTITAHHSSITALQFALFNNGLQGQIDALRGEDFAIHSQLSALASENNQRSVRDHLLHISFINDLHRMTSAF